MKLSWVKDFLILAEVGTFTRAARMRHVTQPAFSRRIAMLEDWLGVQLVDRGARPMQLTPTALRFEPELRRLMTTVDELRNHMRADAMSQPRTVLTMQHTLMITHLPRLLHRLQGEHEVERAFIVNTGNFDRCMIQLDRGRADWLLCFRHPVASPSDHQTKTRSLSLGREQLIPVARSDMGACLLQDDQSDRLVHLINYPDESFLGRIVRHDCLPSLIAGHTTATVCETTFTAGIKEMVVAGRGLAWLPRTLVQPELADGSLIALAPPLAQTTLDISI